jgi:hypothetical protein
MTEPTRPQKGFFSSIPRQAYSIPLMILAYWFFFSPKPPKPIGALRAGSQAIATDEVQTLVGLSAADLRERIGKPDNVQLRSSPLWGNQPNAEECWRYTNRVLHEDSGTKLGLAVYLTGGRCIKAATF